MLNSDSQELSPFPFNRVEQEINKYKNSKGLRKFDPLSIDLGCYCAAGLSRVVWFQEEPSNAGVWSFVQPRLNLLLSSAGLKQREVRSDRVLCSSIAFRRMCLSGGIHWSSGAAVSGGWQRRWA